MSLSAAATFTEASGSVTSKTIIATSLQPRKEGNEGRKEESGCLVTALYLYFIFLGSATDSSGKLRG